mmetsp:Transcript_21023/g.31710  ORF Transcript_21023/g.31710 Transcript_21023/m.31710 type:complete len:427 (+) Transcript_21023:137-1417(+)
MRSIIIFSACLLCYVTGLVQKLPRCHRKQYAITPSRLNAVSETATQSEAEKPMMGNWEELHGNYILRPDVEQGPPRALLHFLGGALVGAVPHVTYRYMLERLVEKGFLVVATPYNLSFDHLDSCDKIIQSFETIAPSLARQYGAVPVVGVGHSCGALLQLLITSLFPDTPRAANALISFNNKPVKEAVPLFDEFFAPFFKSVAEKKDETSQSGVDVINLGLHILRTASEGNIPSDQLVTKVKDLLTPFPQVLPGDVVIPAELRDGIETLIKPSATALSTAGVLPLMNQVVDTLDQIPLLIKEVAEGANDFCPPPASVRVAARRSYRARRTLILQFDNDPIDESDEIQAILQEAESVTRMKRPMVEIDVQRRTLNGNHATPLIAPPVKIANQAEDLLGKDAAKESLLYKEADDTVDELVRWLEEGNL